MTERSLSTEGPRLTVRLFAVRAAISVAITAAIFALAFGPGVFGVIARQTARTAWAPHLPAVGLLAQSSLAIQLHVFGVVTALVVGLVLLAGVKGSRVHRILGWSWVGLMAVAAVASLFIRSVNHGGFSYLHLFTAITFVSLPVGVIAARRHNVRLHGRTMTGLFTGGLVVAGATAFVPGRLMWRMFFG